MRKILTLIIFSFVILISFTKNFVYAAETETQTETTVTETVLDTDESQEQDESDDQDDYMKYVIIFFAIAILCGIITSFAIIRR